MSTRGTMFMQEITTQTLTQNTIPTLLDTGFKLYIVIENLNLSNLYELTKGDEKEALFINTRFSSVMEVSPYLVCLNHLNGDLLNHILKELSGVIIASTHTLPQIRQHLSHYLEVNSEELGATYLRFYSPSVCKSLIEEQPEMFYGFHVITPLMNRSQWGYCKLQQYNLEKKTINISKKTAEIMMINRWGAWLSLLPAWQHKTNKDILKGAMTIEGLVKNQLKSQMLLEKWRNLLSDNVDIIDNAKFQEILEQTQDERTRYEAATQLIKYYKA
ncbi:hypothetical protein CTM84_18890 [Photobacterium kishitanii]|nr:hypothetical protein CTM84_18890 [Photobacterium kishitanii]